MRNRNASKPNIQRQRRSRGPGCAPAAHQKASKRTGAVADEDEFFGAVESSFYFAVVAPRTLQASGILVLAMAAATIYNYVETSQADPSALRLLRSVCGGGSGGGGGGGGDDWFSSPPNCHPRAVPHKRSQRAAARIRPGETVAIVPRSLVLLDADVMLLDEFVRREFAGKVRALGDGGDEPLSGAAFLATHLARLLLLKNATSTSEAAKSDYHKLPPVLREYLNVLPADLSSHPLNWDEGYLDARLAHTSALDHLRRNRALLRREYRRLSAASPAFASLVPFELYRHARLLVLTRAFGTGPYPRIDSEDQNDHPPSDFLIPTKSLWMARSDDGGQHRHHHESSPDEIVGALQSQFGVDLSSGSYAMVPILDLYDHYASPNVGFEFTREGNFHIRAIRAIHSGSVLYDSYGRRTDSDLFARYGFVQGDSSDYTQASLASHRPNFEPYSDRTRESIVRQRGHLLRHLQYDDGYDNCVSQDSDDNDSRRAWELKRLKYQYLLQRADHPRSWTVILSPRHSPDGPPRDLEAIRQRASKLRDDTEASSAPHHRPRPSFANGTSAFTTCRVISLVHTDYGGHAVEVLRELVDDSARHSLPPPPTASANSSNDRSRAGQDEYDFSRALEYRSLFCLARLASSALLRLNATTGQGSGGPEDEGQQKDPASREWSVARVKRGELLTLRSLQAHVQFQLRSNRYSPESGTGADPRYLIRGEACAREYLDPLFQQFGTARV